MRQTQNIVALVPMRHHSVRIAGKNYRPLGGVPLFHHILRTLSKCPSISRTVIDTDSPVVREDVREHFPEIELIERPAHLCADDVPMTEILAYDAAVIGADCYLQTHSTNPFLKVETIESAIACWQSLRHIHDSLFSVTKIQARLWDSTVRPLNHNPWLLLRTQDLPPIFLENSLLYLFTHELITTSRRRIGDRPKPFEIHPLEAIDIDEESTFILAEQIMKVRGQ